MLIKTQRIETRVRTQRLSLGCRLDGVIIVNVNGTSVEVGFMEVVGSAVYDDLTKLSEDLEKVLKCKYVYSLIRHVLQQANTLSLMSFRHANFSILPTTASSLTRSIRKTIANLGVLRHHCL